MVRSSAAAVNERGLSDALGVVDARNGCEACRSSNRCDDDESTLQSSVPDTTPRREKAAMVEEANWILAVEDGLTSGGW